MGLTNADNAFTLYYVKFRAAAPKVRVSIFLSPTEFMQHIILPLSFSVIKWHFHWHFYVLQSLIEQIEQRAEKIPEWVLAFLQNKAAALMFSYIYIDFFVLVLN